MSISIALLSISAVAVGFSDTFLILKFDVENCLKLLLILSDFIGISLCFLYS